jgi:NAD(P)-dependent dehydrogenase (short-subunit alcohol dehydrogenase family)
MSIQLEPMRSPQRLAGKVALITGSSIGIGAAIARRFGAEGAAVALCGRRAHLLQRREEELTACGVKCYAIPGDVAQEAERIVAETSSALGGLDILVNNAAVAAGLAVDEISPAAWRQVMSTNLDAAFELVQAALPLLARRQGSVLHISSISAVSGGFDDIAYAASKAGLEGLSRKLALELAEFGVRSNVIRPGLIRTEAFDGMPADFFDAQIPLIPLKRIGAPAEIAAAAAYLCSDEAAFVTGAVLTIDGGESAR